MIAVPRKRFRCVWFEILGDLDLDFDIEATGFVIGEIDLRIAQEVARGVTQCACQRNDCGLAFHLGVAVAHLAAPTETSIRGKQDAKEGVLLALRRTKRRGIEPR